MSFCLVGSEMCIRDRRERETERQRDRAVNYKTYRKKARVQAERLIENTRKD